MNLKIVTFLSVMMILSSCTEFAMLMSGSSLAMSQNSYAKMYNAVDFGVVLATKKGIKTHVYEKGKKYIYDNTIGFVHKH